MRFNDYKPRRLTTAIFFLTFVRERSATLKSREYCTLKRQANLIGEEHQGRALHFLAMQIVKRVLPWWYELVADVLAVPKGTIYLGVKVQWY